MNDAEFPFQPGDLIVSRGIVHWSNEQPLMVVKVDPANQEFTGVYLEDGHSFTYSTGRQLFHWTKAKS